MCTMTNDDTDGIDWKARDIRFCIAFLRCYAAFLYRMPSISYSCVFTVLRFESPLL